MIHPMLDFADNSLDPPSLFAGDPAPGPVRDRRSYLNLLEADPDLAESVQPGALFHARRAAIAPVAALPAGAFIRERPSEHHSSDTGLFIVSGIVRHETQLGVALTSSQLVGPGSVIHPWHARAALGLGCRQRWSALTPARFGVLDAGFVARIAPYVGLTSALLERAEECVRTIALQLLITQMRRVDERLLMIFALLGDRWGRVRADGTFIPVDASHRLLASLVAATRPSVTSSLSELRRIGLVFRVPDGWVVRGTPDSSELLGVLRERRAAAHEEHASSVAAA